MDKKSLKWFPKIWYNTMESRCAGSGLRFVDDRNNKFKSTFSKTRIWCLSYNSSCMHFYKVFFYLCMPTMRVLNRLKVLYEIKIYMYSFLFFGHMWADSNVTWSMRPSLWLYFTFTSLWMKARLWISWVWILSMTVQGALLIGSSLCLSLLR